MHKPYDTYCLTRQATGKYRVLPDLPENVIDFSSNDYLGFSRSGILLDAAIAAGQKYGVGATGSRLFSGNLPVFSELEAQIASDKITDAALIFNSGFQANQSVLASLLDAKVTGKRAVVFFDRLNHASLYQGVFAAGAKMERYQHGCMNHLESLLIKHNKYLAPKWIITETLFGMDGDIAPLADIIQLAAKYGAGIYLDEAHAMGMIGKSGYGLSTDFDLDDVPCIAMGTFSKALGGSGGYVACSQSIKNYLLNHAPGIIYTTAMSPMLVGAALSAWQKIAEMQADRKRLLGLSEKLRKYLQAAGFNTGLSETHIIPVIMGDEKKALLAREKLLEKKILVSAVRPPTVPPKTSRLRMAVSLIHTEEDIIRLVEGLMS